MACLCLGGVCIPYTALVPMLLFGLRWVACQFAKVGLLPEFIAKRLGVNPSGVTVEADSACNEGCCGESTRRVGKRAKRSSSLATTASNVTASDDDDNQNLEHVDTLERWQEIFTASKNSTLFVKFTAAWCKPCKAIQPAYVALAARHPGKFITLDVDGDDCDVLSSKMKVAMMPTFVCFEGGVERGRMSGGNSGERLGEWVAEMCG